VIDATFSYIVLQPNPQRNRVLYWLDGSPEKRVISIEEFIKTFQVKRDMDIPGMYQALQTYSFYLLSLPDLTIQRLELATDKTTPHPDSVTNVINNKPNPFKRKKAETLEDNLMSMGFNPPDAKSVSNLRVTLSKRDMASEGFLSRWFGNRD